jgi:hypothetical protein
MMKETKPWIPKNTQNASKKLDDALEKKRLDDAKRKEAENSLLSHVLHWLKR